MLLRLDGHGPLYQQLYRALRVAVLRGELRSGERLPSTRALARELGIARQTVVTAYETLLADGWIAGRVGAGTFVAPGMGAWAPGAGHPPRRSGPSSPLGTRLRLAQQLFPPPPLSPASTDPTPLREPTFDHDFAGGGALPGEFCWRDWRSALLAEARCERWRPEAYPQPGGDPGLRREIARMLRRLRGIVCEPEEVQITSGGQQVLDLVARLFVGEGTPVLLEDPHYEGARLTFLAAGAKLLLAPVDADGLRIADATDGGRGARIVYCTPAYQYPTGARLSLERRLALLAFAEAEDALVIEDDYDGEFGFAGRPVEPLRNLDTAGRVLYMGTFSKSMLPSMRIGYVVAPPDLAPLFWMAKGLCDAGNPALEQRALARLLESGRFERHLTRLRRLYTQRGDALRSALLRHLGDHLEIGQAGGGLHLLAWLRRGDTRRADALVAQAAAHGVRLLSGTAAWMEPPARGSVLFRVGALDEARIEAGVRALARAWRGAA